MRTESRNGARNGAGKHLNRTGVALSPALTAELIKGAEQTEPSAEGDGEEIARVRVKYAAEAEPVGSIPPPTTMKGLLKSAVKALTGKQALVLADKLGERLAFERSGVRLYDSLLSKFDAYGTWPGGPSRKDLAQIRAEEHAHFTLVKQAIETMGADPTAVTPSANVHAVGTKGLCAVLADPRTDLRDGLEMILVAELVDNDCWENLIDLARSMGNDDLAQRFEEALGNEREHLRKVRRWLGVALSASATGELAQPFVERATAREGRMAIDSPDDLPGVTSTRPAQGSSRKQARAADTRGAASRASSKTAGGRASKASSKAGSAKSVSRKPAPARGKAPSRGKRVGRRS